MNPAKALFDGALELFLGRESRRRLGAHILNRARGDGDYDPRTNGEYWALGRVQARLRGRPAAFIDAGAHAGEWSKTAAAGLGADSTIYAFEPTRASFSALARLAAAGAPGARIVPVRAALGESDGTAELRVDGDGHGTNSLSPRRLREKPDAPNEPAPSRESAPLVRGDSFCRERGVERVDFLKIDVEGHEVGVLRGFSAMLAARRVDLLQFEYCHAWIDAGHFLREAVELLESYGYAVGKLAGTRVLFLDGYDKSWEKFEFSNFVAMPAERAADWRASRPTAA